MATYKEAGVDIDKANEFVRYIKERVKLPETVINPSGGFASGFILKNFKEPVIMTSTDGVGTKLKIAQAVDIHNTVGIDLVAMNVNDVLTSGAEPLFFLDYIASGRIELRILKEIMEGILKGCEIAQVYLIGGETAEMPFFYPDNVYDLAGFCIGIGEKKELADINEIKERDVLIGIKSSGIHSNGYSLVRKIIEDKKITYNDFIEEFNKKLWEVLLEPTRIYTKQVKSIKETGIRIKASAHITGGGIVENVKRIVPNNLNAVIEKERIPENPVFKWIKEVGKVEEEEMYRTFNMGMGFTVIVDEKDKDKVLNILGEDGFICGYMEKGSGNVLLI